MHHNRKKTSDRRKVGTVLGLIAVGVVVATTAYWMRRSSNSAPQTVAIHRPEASTPPVEAIPPFHESAEAAKPFPQVLPAAYFRSYPAVARAYRIAGQIPETLAQQPCYCYCDKFGHRSLLDCFASDHGAG